VLLIRHAHAGSRRDWDGDDTGRPLSARGMAQAASLVGRLEGWAPVRVLSSPYRRCLQTVEPLAAALGVGVEIATELAEGADGAALGLVRRVGRQSVALCTHGDIIPMVLEALAAEDGLDVGSRLRQAKGSTWVLEERAGRFVTARYLPPPDGGTGLSRSDR